MKLSFELSKFGIDAAFLKRNEQEITKTLNQEMQNTRARIIASNTAGQQAEGGGLKRYSASYKDAIDSGRVAGKSPGNHTPNLTATGTLHRSMKIEPGDQPGEVRMFFEGTHPPARKVSKGHAKKKQRTAITKAGLTTHSRGKSGEIIANVGRVLALGGHAKRANSGVKSQGGGSRPRGPKRSGGGDTQNAVIAQAQYDMGRGGWFTFSTKDIDRIQKRIADLVVKLFTSSFGK